MSIINQMILENMTVLYIEDDIVTRTKISCELKKSVKHLLTAANGREGMQKYYDKKPDIIITDLVMPDCSGIELARELRNDGVDCPIIVTTGVEDTKSIVELVNLGIEQYIVKPIDSQALLETLMKVGRKFIFFQTESYIANQGVLLDKEKQKQIENLFRIACMKYLKDLLGKGPRKVEVSIYGRVIQVKSIDSLTQLEKALLHHGYDYKMVDFNRTFLYHAVKEDIQKKFSEFCNMKMVLRNIEVDSKKNCDRFEFSF